MAEKYAPDSPFYREKSPLLNKSGITWDDEKTEGDLRSASPFDNQYRAFAEVRRLVSAVIALESTLFGACNLPQPIQELLEKPQPVPAGVIPALDTEANHVRELAGFARFTVDAIEKRLTGQAE